GQKKILYFFSSRRRHTIFSRDWSSDVCSSDLELYRESVELHKKYDNTYEIGSVLCQHALCLLKQGKFQESIRLSKEALLYIQKSGALPLQVEVQKNLAQAYAKIGDFSKAYEYSQAYAIGKDSLFEQQKT